jgi:hypothetical protein
VSVNWADRGAVLAALATSDVDILVKSLELDRPDHRETWLALEPQQRQRVLAQAERSVYVTARDWASELISTGRVAPALIVLDDLLVVAERSPFAQADVLRALRRLRRPLDVPAERIHAYAEATLRDVEQRPGLLRVVPDLLRYAAHVLNALDDPDGVVRAVRLARSHGARLARGYAAGPLERIRDDMTLATMWRHPPYAEVFAHLPAPVFTDPVAAVSVADRVRHLRLRDPVALPEGMDRLTAVEVVQLAGAGDATTVAWLTWLAGRPSLHTLELTGGAQQLVADEDLLAALLAAPGLRRLRIGYPPINPQSMRALLADLRRSDAPPRTRLLHLALLRDDVEYVLARARTADLVAALDSGVPAVRAAALHLLDGVFGSPPVRLTAGDEVLIVGRLAAREAVTELMERAGVRIGQQVGPRTRLAVVAERHGGAALELLDSRVSLICEPQLRAVLEAMPAGQAMLPGTGGPPVPVSRVLAGGDPVAVRQALEQLTASRVHRGAFEGLLVVATDPRLDRSLRQAARRLLTRDAPADLFDAAEDVAELVRTLDRTGYLSTWDLQETGIETDGLVDVVELAVLLMAARQHSRGSRLAVVRAGITTLTTAIGDLTRLRELRLDDNHLVELPPPVLRLRELTELSLAGNRLRSLPIALAGLTSLTSLRVGHNALTDFPVVLAWMPWLRRLDLAVDAEPGDRGAVWPGLAAGLSGLVGLTELTLDGHRLEELPAGIARMAGLERLSLRRGELGRLPDWLAQLPQLRWLILDGTVIGRPAAAREQIAQLRSRGATVQAWPTEPGP